MNNPLTCWKRTPKHQIIDCREVSRQGVGTPVTVPRFSGVRVVDPPSGQITLRPVLRGVFLQIVVGFAER